MIEPWDRPHGNAHRHRTLGLKVGGGDGRSNSAIGWMLIESWKTPRRTADRGVEATADPIAAALVRAREAVLTGVEAIDLYRYATDRAFADSRAAADGMTRQAHARMVGDLARQMRAEGLPVEVKVIR